MNVDSDKPILQDGRLKRALECMLFVSPQPLSAQQVAKALELEESEVELSIHELRLDYAERGLQIVRIADGYQMCTRPEYADCVSSLLTPQRTRLSRAALETAAIVAYRQPITQPEIDAIRGVNSDGVLKTLVDRGLIHQAGRRETVGRPILYATTDEFLNYFGLNDLSQLPELEGLAVAVEEPVLTESSEPSGDATGSTEE